ncbi:ATP-binding protein [Streptomyces chartreusis]|uniref:ATP-binding protein n=1 Tax=Streptomyces chartreusis TaxID=1969 RepID=UPI002E801A9C|nr:ATP-binding protein [Streptomyces chartreusis]WUB18277.1 ATP-binding protein [Streptomyces chartreusis]
MYCTVGLTRAPWTLPFAAEPAEVASLRRIIRLRLELWGLHSVVSDAQLCVDELVSNVIDHVGVGTPATLAVSMRGTCLRIEVHDPDTQALPALIRAEDDSEAGRGMVLIDALADRWGVQLQGDGKVTWCEMVTELATGDGHSGGGRVSRVEALVSAYKGDRTHRPRPAGSSVLTLAAAEVTAIDMIADLLHWLRAHGCDPDTALDRAQTHFEAEISEAEGSAK